MAQIPASILRIGVAGETLLEALPRMREAYCGTVAYQIEHLSSHQQRMWLREMIETGAHRIPLTDEEKKALLERLIEVFRFERFLQRAYLGQKMFSIEGLDAVVPMIDELLALARKGGAQEVVLGMAHRGRLAVLAHNLGRPVESIMAEFEGAQALERSRRWRRSRTGGPETSSTTSAPRACSRPPTATRSRSGSTRTRATSSSSTRWSRAARGPSRPRSPGRSLEHDPSSPFPLLLHGDAAFPGQGVVAETLNLQSLKGYSTGGTVHLITDNQVGFTTDPRRPARPPTRPTWRRGSTSRSSTSTPTTSRRASRRSGSRWPTASAGAATSSST